VLAVLLLRGPQTPGELKQRTERMQAFAELAAVQDVLDSLVERELVLRLARRPGQKEERYMHRLSEEAEGAAPVEAPEPAPLVAAPPRAPAISGRVEQLESEVAALRDELTSLRAELTTLREELGA
jgi:uncharacterized protein YceH (UPF0502 family)